MKQIIIEHFPAQSYHSFRKIMSVEKKGIGGRLETEKPIRKLLH